MRIPFFRPILIFLLIFVSHHTQMMANPPKLSKVPVETNKPNPEKTYPIAVIGGGAAGTMATLRCVLNHNEVLLFTGAKQERRRSRGNWVRTVDTIPGLANYSRALLELRNETLQKLYQSPLSHDLYIIEDSILSIRKEGATFRLTDTNKNSYRVKYVVLATGIMDEQPHIQGSIRPILKYANAQTAAYCLTCDGHRSLGKKTVVMGHSDEAANNAIVLAEKYEHRDLILLTNGEKPKIQPALIEKMQKLQIRIETESIVEVIGINKKELTGFKLANGNVVPASMVFVSLGIRPNNQLAIEVGAALDDRGLVLTDSLGETKIPNFFVCGDLRANSMKQIYTAWQQAVESSQLINKRIRAEQN